MGKRRERTGDEVGGEATKKGAKNEPGGRVARPRSGRDGENGESGGVCRPEGGNPRSGGGAGCEGDFFLLFFFSFEVWEGCGEFGKFVVGKLGILALVQQYYHD